MKKILLLAVAVGIGMTACKKEEEVKPTAKIEKGIMAGDKKDLGSWD